VVRVFTPSKIYEPQYVVKYFFPGKDDTGPSPGKTLDTAAKDGGAKASNLPQPLL
jgi:hypothetical protein